MNDIKRKIDPSYCDNFFAVRRNLIVDAGGYPNSVGYGGDKDEACHRLVGQGGFLTIFQDLIYYHLEHYIETGKYQWTESSYHSLRDKDYSKEFSENELIAVKRNVS